MKILKLNEFYNTQNLKNSEDLAQYFEKIYKINDDDFDLLFYCIHSDDHVGENLKPIIAKLQKNGDIPKMNLYRGCSDEELESIKTTGKTIVDTLSFSEDKNIAKGFGKNIIEIESTVPMFCYHKFLKNWYTALRSIDPDEYDAVDGDFMIESADEELEWICTNDYKFISLPDKSSDNTTYFKLER